MKRSEKLAEQIAALQEQLEDAKKSEAEQLKKLRTARLLREAERLGMLAMSDDIFDRMVARLSGGSGVKNG